MDRTQSSVSVTTALKRVESYQYPNTHAGHLSESQATALADFQNLCQDKGYYTPETSKQHASHDDETLLRYLRARKFVPKDAFVQFKDTEDWRKTNKIDNLYETIDVTEYDETRKLYPQWTGRRDKRGIPLYAFEVAPLNSKRMAAYEKSMANLKGTGTGSGTVSPKLLRLFALYENLLRFTMPLCSGLPNRPYSETPVSQSNNIVDIAGVGLKQFWNLKQHMQDASQLATAHYPETLDRIFIIGAPSFFPTVWSWIKGWFDPITVSKIFILSKANMHSTLTKYIDPANIPRKYGGTLDWEWGDLPNLEPEIIEALQWQNPAKGPKGQNGFPVGPVKWRENAGGDLVAHAVGSVNGKPRNDIIATLPIHETNLNLGPAMSIETPAPTAESTSARQDAEKKSPYQTDLPTTGTHTHPSDSQEYFPASGVTPPEEHDDSSLENALNSPRNEGPVPVRDSATAGSEEIRTGTSSVRYAEQDQTLAAGQLKDGTPATIDRGDGDKVNIMEPSTVAQAHKNVDVPEAEPASQGEEQSKGYVQQAKEVAGAAYSTTAAVVAGAGSTVLAAVGLGESNTKGGDDAEAGESHASLAEATKNLSLGDTKEGQQEPAKVADDPAVDKMADKDVEEFIRSKYVTDDPANS